MKRTTITLALCGTFTAAASAQTPAASPVTIYGILDVAVENARSSAGDSSSTMMKQTGHVPSRLGFRGGEKLGGGMRVGFELEGGIGLNSGSFLQGGRPFGRAAYVSLGSTRAGDVRLGRQLSLMQAALAPYDPDHFSPYSPALAMQLSNLEQTSLSNVVSYWSPQVAGFSGALAYSLSDGAAVAPNPGAPQVVGAGAAKDVKAALLRYRSGGLSAALGFQAGGQDLASGGDAEQRMASLAALYKWSVFEVGGVYWIHRNELSNGRTPTTKVWTVGTKWHVSPSMYLVAQVGQARDNGQVYATGAAKAEGSDTYLNFGGTYSFSKRTAVYVRFGRIEDENSGFNGRPAIAAVSVRDTAAVPANGSTRAVAVGLRHSF